MARAELKRLEETVIYPCPSCGSQGHQRLRLITEKKRVAWDGCEFCWGLIARRNQIETIRLLCREVDRDVRPGPNARALMG